MGRVAINISMSLDDDIIGRDPGVGRLEDRGARGDTRYGRAGTGPGTAGLLSFPSKHHLPKGDRSG